MTGLGEGDDKVYITARTVLRFVGHVATILSVQQVAGIASCGRVISGEWIGCRLEGSGRGPKHILCRRLCIDAKKRK